MLTRAVRVEPAPRGGWLWAWTFDELASPNTTWALRRLRVRRLREQRRQIMARLEAEDRLRPDRPRPRGPGRAGLAMDRVALTPRGSRTLDLNRSGPGRAIRPGYLVRITQAS